MDVAVIGGHGKVALRLLRSLAERGDRARGVIRNPDHVADLEAIGAEAIACDLESEPSTRLAAAIAGADAVVFAAGAGPGSGPARKRTVDYGGSVALIAACREARVSRYVMVSSIGSRDPESGSEPMRPYLQAKHDADRELETSGLEHTIVRPGGLTDEPGAGRIDAAPQLGRRGQIPRDDVAATLLACLEAPNTIGLAFEVVGGETPIADAVATLKAPV